MSLLRIARFAFVSLGQLLDNATPKLRPNIRRIISPTWVRTDHANLKQQLTLNMDSTNKNHTSLTGSSDPKQEKSLKWTSSRVLLKSDLYRKISAELAELSMQVGYEVPMSKFLGKTVAENWEAEIARYKRIDSSLHRNKS